jgi:hypothetical protein
MIVKPEFVRQGWWLDKASYWKARKNGYINNFRSKDAYIGMVLQLAVADELGYRTSILIGKPDHGVDIVDGYFIIDIKGQKSPPSFMSYFHLWNQNFNGKLNNLFIFAEGAHRQYRIMGWLWFNEALKIPLEKHRDSQYLYRRIPLKKMHPIESLQQLIFTTKIIGKAGNQI